MNINDWLDTGDRIINIVQDAVETGDYSNLSGKLGSTVRQGTGGASRGGSYVNSAPGGASRGGGYVNSAPGGFSGMAMAVLGYGAAAVFAFLLLCVQAIGYFYWIRVGVTSMILLILCIVSLIIGIKGTRKWSLAKRFGRYTRIIGGRSYCRIIEISSVVGRKESSVAKDLKAMIKQGMFPQGHLDKNETCFIADNATYQQYLIAQRSYEERLEAEKQERKQSKKKQAASESSASKQENDGLTPECRELIEEGRGYIRHFRECNDRIPGEEMTGKLYTLERTTARIFAEAERNPEVVGDLKKMMNYYLPTTKKLLDAYCEMDSQPVQGPNIVSTKKEIEKSIDTINEAFANLLDSLFEDTAWDISSDIDVLNTMFAQEGLTGSAFDKDKTKVH